MSLCRILFAVVVVLASSYVRGEQELFKNRDWAKLKTNVPVNWRFMTYSGKSAVKLTSEIYKEKKVAVIVSNKIKGQGYIGQYTKVQIPAGQNIVLSGYYRTENIALGSKGRLFVDIKYNYSSKDKKFPRKYQSTTLKPSKKWRKFAVVKSFNVPIKDFYAFFMLYRASGKLYFSNLSLRLPEGSSKIDSREKYIWREAENISKFAHTSTWGKATKDYFSGKGGIYLKSSPFKWTFRIKKEVNPKTLMPEKRTYFLWVRMYGYLDQPKVSIFFKKQKISSFKTSANEKIDAKGEYTGPGKYYWQKAGSFRAAGGAGDLKLVPQGRMLLDAIIVTTDEKYSPTQYEARKAADKNFFTDVQTPHMIKSEYRIYGISDKVITPLIFRYQGKIVKIPEDKQPAILHVSIPASVKVKNISSHWGGKTWNRPERWGNKYLTWKKIGSENVNGTKHNKYEIYLYYLSLTYHVFVQSEKAGFQAGKNFNCKYYLEYKGEKQLVETVPLRSIGLKQVKAFKKILIGPAGGNARGIYEEFPDLATNMAFSGLNVMNPWHLYPNRDGSRWGKLRDQSVKNNITVLGQLSPFYGRYRPKEKKFQAMTLAGKYDSHRPALSINEKSAAFQQTLNYLTEQCALGVTGIVFDDEHYNQQKDKFDYNPVTRKQFKKYVKKLGIDYIDPVKIVKDKKKYSAQYKAWVDFKCDCMVNIYRKFKKAYLKGFAEAKTSSTFGRTLFVAQILKNNSPQESKINTYWDYKKLAPICDYISPMIYTYDGIKGSARVGDLAEMYNDYIGKKVIAPTLLCEHSGFGGIDLTQKKMFKYQIIECLMQQAGMILFWHGPAVFNPVNLQHISAAIRLAAPYEDIILKGEKYKRVFSPQQWVRIKGLKLNKRILLYVANYRNAETMKAQIKFKAKIKSILEIGIGKQLLVNDNSFSIDFKSDRGKLFIVTLQ
jgi:hypothetical protein